jgi:hypothetical protein
LQRIKSKSILKLSASMEPIVFIGPQSRRGRFSQNNATNADRDHDREQDREEIGAALQGPEGRHHRVRRQRRRLHRA